ncbi:hypothetical protein YC2023_084483 [Brassica napus]
MRDNFLDSELSTLRNFEALFSTCSVSMTGTRLPDKRAQAVRSLGSLLNYVRLDPRKGPLELGNSLTAFAAKAFMISGMIATLSRGLEIRSTVFSKLIRWCSMAMRCVPCALVLESARLADLLKKTLAKGSTLFHPRMDGKTEVLNR